MITHHMTAETAEARLARRFGSSVQVQLRALAKSETQKCQNYFPAEFPRPVAERNLRLEAEW
jgi:hypothetical protein